ncbi:7571_t:CDS:2 [Paraglomus occultum]|uniref:7571_t:CDS:1 n=1 Tax=Paraglomus occultum TaxID=144539 RepID=A0A9N9G9E4_9GLOM|nr:7571_t:CDS:2 [Paraglomus occultum]
MNSLGQQHANHIHQYLQLQQAAAASALSAPNPLGLNGATSLSNHLQASANLHPLSIGPEPWATASSGPLSLPLQHQQKYAQIEEEKIYGLVIELLNPATREQALSELSRKRDQYEDLALILWHSFAHIPFFLYPFLNTTSKIRPFEFLRLTSLGVIGALVKNDNTEVIQFLLSTEIIPFCLRIMETGSELSKTVAIFIVQKILSDDTGLNYICGTYERFYAVGTVLNNMVNQLVETRAARLLKHVVRCYVRLSENPKAREALRQCLPEPLRDATFSQVLKDDPHTKHYLAQLLLNLSDNVVTNN